MRTVKGKYDGKVVHLEQQVPVSQEVEVVVEFPDACAGQQIPAKQDLVDFLLTGPTFTKEEIDSIETGIKELRRWRS